MARARSTTLINRSVKLCSRSTAGAEMLRISIKRFDSGTSIRIFARVRSWDLKVTIAGSCLLIKTTLMMCDTCNKSSIAQTQKTWKSAAPTTLSGLDCSKFSLFGAITRLSTTRSKWRVRVRTRLQSSFEANSSSCSTTRNGSTRTFFTRTASSRRQNSSGCRSTHSGIKWFPTAFKEPTCSFRTRRWTWTILLCTKTVRYSNWSRWRTCPTRRTGTCRCR